MKRFSQSLVILILLLLPSCSHFEKRGNNPNLSFTVVRQVIPGKATRSTIRALLGDPQEKSTGKNMEGDYWYYHDARGYTRASFQFPKNFEVVETVSWEVNDGDSEQELRTALDVFPRAKWEVTVPEWFSSHTIPGECIFQDKQLGAAVEFRKVRKEVSSIWWWDTSRQPATEDLKAKCPYDSCDGLIHRDEWLKNSTWLLCDIPK